MQGVESTLLAAAVGIAKGSQKREGNEILAIQNGRKVRTVQVKTRLAVAPPHPGYQSPKSLFSNGNLCAERKGCRFLLFYVTDLEVSTLGIINYYASKICTMGCMYRLCFLF